MNELGEPSTDCTALVESRPAGQPPDFITHSASGPRTIGDAIRAHAEARPTEPAMVGSDCPPLSYRMLQDEIEDVRRSLRGAGFDRSARIAVAIANSAQAARAIVAIA